MIYIDSNIFIYVFNENPEYFKASLNVVNQIRSGGPATTSTIAVAEVLSREYNAKMRESLKLIENLEFIPVDENIASKAGSLRSKDKTLKLPDAIHIATALNTRATIFVTNDKKLLAKKKIDSLRFVSILDYEK